VNQETAKCVGEKFTCKYILVVHPTGLVSILQSPHIHSSEGSDCWWFCVRGVAVNLRLTISI